MSILDFIKIGGNIILKEITAKLTFKKVKEIDDSIIYAEPSLSGYNAVMPNYHQEESKLDMELLFNAILAEKIKFKPLFS